MLGRSVLLGLGCLLGTWPPVNSPAAVIAYYWRLIASRHFVGEPVGRGLGAGGLRVRPAHHALHPLLGDAVKACSMQAAVPAAEKAPGRARWSPGASASPQIPRRTVMRWPPHSCGDACSIV